MVEKNQIERKNESRLKLETKKKKLIRELMKESHNQTVQNRVMAIAEAK
jgi:hypothetical protein